MTDEKIIDLFWQRDEQAIRECMDTYGAYCRTVAAGILTNSEDVEETVADTWLAAWNAIPPYRPQYLRLFLGRITRNRAISVCRAKAAKSRGGEGINTALEELGQCLPADSDPLDAVSLQQLQKSITAFLKKEPMMRRQVFLWRYFYMEDIPAIAHRYGLKDSNVRMMLSRTRQKLRKYLIQEGYMDD